MNEEINLHIEKLVLQGIDQNDTEGIRKAIINELTNLMANQGVPNSWHNGQAVPKNMGQDVSLNTNTKSAQIGTNLAGSIYNGLKGGRKP